MFHVEKIERTEQPWRSATETMVETIGQFSKHEPKGVLIIYTDEDGGVTLTGNTSKCLALGMLETVKHMILSGDHE